MIAVDSRIDTAVRGVGSPAEGEVTVVVATHQVPHTVLVSVTVSAPLPARLEEGFTIFFLRLVRWFFMA